MTTLWLTCVLLAAVPAPQPLWPRDGQALTDVATFFRWEPLKGYERFHVQVGADREFTRLVRERRTRNQRYHEDLWFPREVLPAGAYCWRVRATDDAGQDGPWCEPRAFTVNADHALAPALVRTISPQRPVFLMRNREWNPARHQQRVDEFFPAELRGIVVPDDIHVIQGTPEALARADAYEQLGLDFVVWTNRARFPLPLLEYLFQHCRHCLGAAEGEHFWGWHWERGPEGNVSEEDFLRRAFVLCGKYGRYYFWGDGESSSYRWTSLADEWRDVFAVYGHNIVPMFKSTIGQTALHSVGATEGLMASGRVDHSGYWADEFVWGECGFGRRGEFFDKGRGTTQGCPWTYDLQMWLMGVAAGSTVFHLESAHPINTEGGAAANYQRFFRPFVQAVVRHGLLPSRQAWLDSQKLAVACEAQLARQPHGGRYGQAFGWLGELYALKRTPFQELIPDCSRYGLIALLPPDAQCLNPRTTVIAQRDLLAPGAARARFDAAYPARFGGDAFVWECDGTVIVTNSNENVDVDQHFDIPLQAGALTALRGTIGVQQYLLGKARPDGCWFQVNGEDRHRPVRLELVCKREPRVTVSPSGSPATSSWQAGTQVQQLTLSVDAGAVEVEVR